MSTATVTQTGNRMEETTRGGELTRGTKVPTVITTSDDFRTSLSSWRQHQFHILTPIADFRALPPQYGLMPATVQINTDLTAGEVYQDKLFCEDGEVAISKIGLSKIALAAGMSIKTERTDPRTMSNYWEVRASARFTGIDGTPQELDATEELDLRDGSERSRKVMGRNNSQPALTAARAKGLRNCEARAVNAVIRQFGIKQKYKITELQRAFVVMRVVFQPDMSDPVQAQFVMERALAGTATLYGRQERTAAAAPQLLDEIGDTRSVDPRPVGSSSSPLAQGSASTPSTPKVGTGLKVVEVKPKSGKTGERDWTVYQVSFSDGRVGATFDEAMAKTAYKARDGKADVEVLITETARGPKLEEIAIVTSGAGDDELPLDLPDFSKL